MTSNIMLSRKDLAIRWATSTRTIDRLRNAGKLPWIDLSAGRGSRPIVRFRGLDLTDFEQSMRRSTINNARKEE